MVLANLKLQNPKRKFDAANKEDLRVYKNFLENGTWGGTCPFELEQPYLEIPYMIAVKIAEKHLEKI
jgi:hypothetical protein